MAATSRASVVWRYLPTGKVKHALRSDGSYVGHARVTAWRGARADHPDLLAPTLALLGRITTPWVIENVPEAPLRRDFLLCGSQFGLAVRRHRVFQTSPRLFDLVPPCRHHRLMPFGHKAERAYADALGCPWMTNLEARQAIPPAYTHHIGSLLIDRIASVTP